MVKLDRAISIRLIYAYYYRTDLEFNNTTDRFILIHYV